jgi:hypothetical protein
MTLFYPPILFLVPTLYKTYVPIARDNYPQFGSDRSSHINLTNLTHIYYNGSNGTYVSSNASLTVEDITK